MYHLIQSFLNFAKVNRMQTCDIYFTINTKITSVLVLFFSALLSTMNVLRVSIDCHTDVKYNRKAVMDNFCWSIGTFTCKDTKSDDMHNCFSPVEEDKTYQRYYQWVPLVFLLQAAIFYTPAYFWKLAEGGLMHKICNQMGELIVLSKQKFERAIKMIVFSFQ